MAHLAPANGFPSATYAPALGGLTRSHRVVSLPPRALWPDAGPPSDEPGSWVSLADDLLEGMRRHQLGDVIGIGHSFGAVATLLAAVREPGRFRALVFLDPTILPPAIMDELRRLRERGEMSFRPLVQGALKRRSRFGSEAEAFRYWREKQLFSDWSDDAVQRYAASMLRPAKGGDGLELAWSPGWEAWYYMSFFSDSWAELERLDSSIPLLVVRGERSDTFFPDAEALFREIRPDASFHVVPGRGHLFPQAAPEETGRLLAEWLARIEGG